MLLDLNKFLRSWISLRRRYKRSFYPFILFYSIMFLWCIRGWIVFELRSLWRLFLLGDDILWSLYKCFWCLLYSYFYNSSSFSINYIHVIQSRASQKASELTHTPSCLSHQSFFLHQFYGTHWIIRNAKKIYCNLVKFWWGRIGNIRWNQLLYSSYHHDLHFDKTSPVPPKNLPYQYYNNYNIDAACALCTDIPIMGIPDILLGILFNRIQSSIQLYPWVCAQSILWCSGQR